MKKLICIFIIICLIATGYFFKGDIYRFFSDAISEINEFLPQAEEITEIKYEYYTIESPEFSSCFDALNRKQKEIYSRINTISREMPEGFIKLTENYSNAPNDVTIAYTAFLYDNAEVFWMPQRYILATAGEEKSNIAIAFQYSDGDNTASYNVSKSQRDNMIIKLNAVCDKVISKTKKLKGDYEKEKYINDFICNKVSYAEKGRFVHTAYGALVEGKALCEGYSRAFKYLCNLAGIECDLIVGEAEKTGHMWNRVNIDKKHSYVDTTWNDRSEFKTYTYFNISEEQLIFDHIISPVFTEISEKDLRKNTYNFTKKECTYTGDTFYEKNGQVLWLDYADTASAKIEKAKENGKTFLEFMFATKQTMENFKKNPEAFIEKIQSKLIKAVINSYSAERDTIILFFE